LAAPVETAFGTGFVGKFGDPAVGASGEGGNRHEILTAAFAFAGMGMSTFRIRHLFSLVFLKDFERFEE
jgi:hypothetical protein